MIKTATKILRALLREIITPPALILAALLFLWEEVLWVWLGRAMGVVARLPAVARLEAFVAGMRPYPAIAIFCVPLVLVYPAKLVALWLMATGHFWPGVVLLAALEFLAAAVMARIYQLTKPALRRFGWFVWAEGLVLRWSGWAHERMQHLIGWRHLREMSREAAAEARRDFDNGGGLT